MGGGCRKGGDHKERMRYIDQNVPESFRPLVRDHMIDFLALEIYQLPTKAERQQALADIPLDCDPPWARSLVKCRVLHMWKEGRR